MMSKFLFIFLFIVTIPFTSSTHTHPIKLTSSEIKYDVKSKSLRVECKVFIDDFAPAISPSLLVSLNQEKLSEADKQRIENYFVKKYKIAINSKNFTWKIDSYDISKNVLSLVFYNQNITIKKGDQLRIENTLLFEAFGEIQSNWMTVIFPPYVKNYNFESVIDYPVYSKTF